MKRTAVFSAAVAVLAFIAYLALTSSVLPPEVWTEYSIAAGLRAPGTIFPGIPRLIGWVVCHICDPASVVRIMRLIAHLLVASSVGFAYLAIRRIFRMTLEIRVDSTPARQLSADVICAFAALVFGVSTPMMSAAQALTDTTVMTFLSMLVLSYFFRWIKNGLVAGATMAFFCGIAAAETPHGLILIIVCVALNYLASHGYLGDEVAPSNYYHVVVSKWVLPFSFIVGFAGMVFVNASFFTALGGLSAVGLSEGQVLVEMLLRYVSMAMTGASATGLLLMLGVVILPFVLLLILAPNGVDEDRLLKHGVGSVLLGICLLSLSQLSGIGALRFTSWTSVWTVSSTYLLILAAFLSALTFALSLAIGVFDIFFRNFRQIAMFAERIDDEEEDLDEDLGEGMSYVRRNQEVFSAAAGAFKVVRVIVAIVIPVVTLIVVWPVPGLQVRRSMTAVVDSAVREIAREAKGLRWVFTDGWLDAGIEFAAYTAGHRVLCLSLMAGESPYERHLRMRGAQDADERTVLGQSVSAAYRQWVLHDPAKAALCGFQLGTELIKASGHEMPKATGLLARYGFETPDEAQRGTIAAQQIAVQALNITSTSTPLKMRASGGVLNHCFQVVMWRLARLARLRADEADLTMDGNVAKSELSLAADLEQANPAVAPLKAAIKETFERIKRTPSPLEGLRQALARADFSQAARFGETVLQSNPQNADAHFAMGMFYYSTGRYVMAESHLKTCLAITPKDPAVWNNLAMVQLSRGGVHLDDAERNARRALELLPKSTAVSNTLVQVLKAKDFLANKPK